MNPFAKLSVAEVEQKSHIIKLQLDKTAETLRKMQCHAARKYTIGMGQYSQF